MTAASDGAESPETALVAEELRALRKGRGMGAGNLDRRVGPRLQGLASDATGSAFDAAAFRTALSNGLMRCAARLPDDLRTAALAGLGLAPGTTQMEHFGDRVTWLAERIDRNYRTALRRVDEAGALLAEEITRELDRRRTRPADAADGWYLDELSTVLRLDTPKPEAHEYRRIIAVLPGLAEVTISLDVPAPPGERVTPDAEIVFGGTLVRREQPSRTRTQFVVRLPAPLQPGEKHDFELVVRIPSADLMRPHYIFTPERECNSFNLRVRFPPGRTPAWVRLVDGETVRTFDETRPDTRRVAIDSTGEAHVAFSKPSLYLGYGLQWQGV